MDLGFFYDFRPIGQGLFSIGRLTQSESSSLPQNFTWVHDCGTDNLTATAFNSEVTALTSILDHGQLDLLILSHFDNDHISGLITLLGLCHVRRLVIPYLTPAERLLVLFSTVEASDNLQRFLAAPIAFIRAQQGGQETEIMFIGEPPEAATNAEQGGNFNPDTPVDIGKKKPFTDKQQADDPDLAAAAQSRPALLKDESTPLTIWGMWEFCFYNLPPEEVRRDVELAELWRRVEPQFTDFHRRAIAGQNQGDLIAKMRQTYRDVFGTTDKQRNDISLVTYSGPVKRNLIAHGIYPFPVGILYPAGAGFRPEFTVGHKYGWLDYCLTWGALSDWPAAQENSKSSLLYTGDITLTDNRAREIKRLLTDWRWDEIEVFQVPHHGAESSWKIKPSSLSLFTHRYSVFSSARYDSVYLHPRDSVLDALKKTTRVLVNEYTGAVFHGFAMWESPAPANPK